MNKNHILNGILKIYQKKELVNLFSQHYDLKVHGYTI
jgi:hypothetical protein